MKKLLAFIVAAGAAFGAGTVNQTTQPLGASGNFAITFYWTGDPSNGSVPVTLANMGILPQGGQGMRIIQVETSPGTTSPTNGYNVALKDSFGGDIMSNALAGLSSTTTQFFAPPGGAPPLLGAFSLSLSGNSVASATGSVTVYLGPITLVNSTVGSQGPAGPAGAPGTPGGGVTVLASAYVFTPQTPGVSLASGNNTITMTPVPLGVNGSDSNHFLYVSGGTGTAEACKINGGTGLAGQGSGTIIINCANTHTGAWTIQTATGGIAEAIQAIAPGGGTVSVSTGTITAHSSIWMQSNTCLVGTGESSIIQVASGAYGNTAPWQWGGNGTAGAINSNGGSPVTNICIRSLTLDMNGSTQTITGITSALADGILLSNTTESIVDSVIIKNNPNNSSIVFVDIQVWVNSLHDVISNNFLYGAVCSAGSGGMQGVGVTGVGHKVAYNFANNGCAGGFGTGSGTDTVFVGNTFDLASSTMVAGAQAYFADSSNNTTFVGNTCIGNNTGPACFTAITDAATVTGTTFEGNIAVNCGEGYQLGASGGFSVIRTAIHGGRVSNCASPMTIQQTGGGIVTDVGVKDVPGLYGDFPGIVAFGATNENLSITDIGTVLGSASGNFSIGGFTGGFEGRRLTVINGSGANIMTINNNDASSTAGNRICVPGGTNFVFPARTSIANFEFSTLSSNCWWLVSTF